MATYTDNGAKTGSGYWHLRTTITTTDKDYNGYPSTEFYVVLARYADKADTSGYNARNDTSYFTVTNGLPDTIYQATPTWNATSSKRQVRTLISGYIYVNRTKEDQTITVYGYNKHPSGTMGGTSTTSRNIVVPALPQYNVSYDVQGIGTAPQTESVFWGDPATEPQDPTASGYAFRGWYTESSCTNLYDFSTLITDAITLYAKWEETATPIYFKNNGQWVSGNLKVRVNGDYTSDVNIKIKSNGQWVDI